jgi:hypothetical protein
VKSRRQKVEAIRNSTLFEMGKLEQVGNPANSPIVVRLNCGCLAGDYYAGRDPCTFGRICCKKSQKLFSTKSAQAANKCSPKLPNQSRDHGGFARVGGTIARLQQTDDVFQPKPVVRAYFQAQITTILVEVSNLMD